MIEGIKSTTVVALQAITNKTTVHNQSANEWFLILYVLFLNLNLYSIG
jgi:hypothetical protein